jgi:hypothetical protein
LSHAGCASRIITKRPWKGCVAIDDVMVRATHPAWLCLLS